MRKKGPYIKKVQTIKATLKRHPDGLWIREIARQSKISKSTVHRYIREYLKNDVECALKVAGLMEVYRLKKK